MHAYFFFKSRDHKKMGRNSWRAFQFCGKVFEWSLMALRVSSRTILASRKLQKLEVSFTFRPYRNRLLCLIPAYLFITLFPWKSAWCENIPFYWKDKVCANTQYTKVDEEGKKRKYQTNNLNHGQLDDSSSFSKEKWFCNHKIRKIERIPSARNLSLNYPCLQNLALN